VTGKDLNWYFNQWYFGSGHPQLDISYKYDDDASPSGKVTVIVKQLQKGNKVFRLPVKIDIYNGTTKTTHQVWVENRIDSFTFNYTKRPDLVNVDADKILLAEKQDNKTLENFIHQYKYAGNYVDRREAIEFAAEHQDEAAARDLMKLALNDPYYELRMQAINSLDMKNEEVMKMVESQLATLAKNDKYSVVRASAIRRLGDYMKTEYAELFRSATKDSSYSVAGAALGALAKIDSSAALEIAKQLSTQPAKGALKSAITAQIVKSGDLSMAEKIISDFENQPLQAQFNELNNLVTYLSVINDFDKVKRGIDAIVKLREAVPDAYRNQTDPYINGMILKGLLASKKKAAAANPSDAGLQSQVQYLESVMPDADKKGF